MYEKAMWTLSDVMTLDQQGQIYSRVLKKKKERKEGKERGKREPIRLKRTKSVFSTWRLKDKRDD